MSPRVPIAAPLHTAALATRLLVLIAFLALTNSDVLQRIVLLMDQQRWFTLAGFFAVWGLSVFALLIAAFQPNVWLRFTWAVVLAATTAIAVGFREASNASFGVFDVVSLWNARHESARAMEFYASSISWMAVAFVCGVVILATPPPVPAPKLRRLLTRAAWVPAVPVALIAGLVYFKEGGGAQALPSQFTPLSVGIVSGVTLATGSSVQRHPVEWEPAARKIRRIVVLVDESVRGDYIDWTPGNPYTPELAKLKSRIVDFGPAASGGNCSHYSNAILRFVATRESLGRDIIAHPTIWQFAKKAGFRTVFIDAQAGFVRNPGKLQNFMTVEETKDINVFHALDQSIPPPELDHKLLDVLLEELRADGPVFIYANKNGAHFPYDRGYPESEAVFRPRMSEAAQDQTRTRVNSYRNVLKWSVDRFFKRLFDETDLSDTLILYTSDHGQALRPGWFTHCSLDKPDPREALVPLFAITGDEALRARLSTAAKLNAGHASHFSISPTVLEVMGYANHDIAAVNGASLLRQNRETPSFTTGDIFGLFSTKVRWHDIDLRKTYME